MGTGRRGGRARGPPKAAAQPDPVPEESVKPVEQEVVPVEDKKEETLKVEDVIQEKVEDKLVIDHSKSKFHIAIIIFFLFFLL